MLILIPTKKGEREEEKGKLEEEEENLFALPLPISQMEKLRSRAWQRL